MAKTLKEAYQQKKITEVTNKLKLVDKKLIESDVDYQVALLFEALDEKEFQEAAEAIEKLRKIGDVAKSSGMDATLSPGIEKAINAINQFTGGDSLSRLGAKASSLFSKSPAKNPILGGLAIASALEAGFKMLPDILKNNINNLNDSENLKKPIEDIVTDEKIKNAIINNVVKAFVPKGIFGKVFGNVAGLGLDPKTLAADILSATPEQLGVVIKTVESGTTTDQIDPNLANPEEAGTSEDEEPTAEEIENPSPEQQKKNTQATQDAAKKAGISNGKALLSLFDELGYKLGSFEGSLVVPELQKLQRKFNIPDNQTDGFTRGLMVDFEKDFKANLVSQIEKEIERIKREQEKK